MNRHVKPSDSPKVDDPYIFDEEEEILSILESAHSDGDANERAVAVVRRICEREAKLKLGLQEIARQSPAVGTQYLRQLAAEIAAGTWEPDHE